MVIKDKAVNELKERLIFEGYEYTDLAIYYKLYAEKKWAKGQLKLYDRFTIKSGLFTWFDVHEPYEGNEPRKLWGNGWSYVAKLFTNDELIIIIKKLERNEMKLKNIGQ